eukprot:RCo005818
MATPFCSSDQEHEYQPSSSPLRLFWVSCMPAGGGLVSSPATLWVEVWWFSWPPEWCIGVSCACAAAGWVVLCTSSLHSVVGVESACKKHAPHPDKGFSPQRWGGWGGHRVS